MGTKGSQTTTTTQAPQPQFAAQYSQLANQAVGLSQQPYQPYGGQLTAPINQQQQAAIGNVNTLYPEVSGMLTNASSPITAAQIQQYYNPFQQNVIDTTEKQFANTNAQQQQQVLGNAVAQGALGGNRTGVAQAVLAGQQQTAEAPVLAGLENTGYNQAVQYAMQQFQQNPEQAAGLLSSTGTNIANAQFGYGTAEQQTAQNQLNAEYQQYLAAQGYPFQALNFATGEVGSLGSLAGGTGQVIAPPPSLTAQYGGLATAGVGAYALSDRRLKEDVHKVGETNDGQPIYRFRFKGSPQWHIGLMAQDVEKKHPDAVGRAGDYKTVDIKGATDAAVKRRVGGLVPDFAGGGAPLMPYSGGPSYIPAMQAVHGSGPPHPVNATSQDTGVNQILQNATKMAGAIKSGSGTNSYGGGNIFTDAYGGSASSPLEGLTAEDYGANGGRVMRYGGLVLPARNRIEYKRGGPIRAGLGFSSFVPRRGYQYGGSPEELAAEGVPATFDERFPTQPGLAPADFDARFQGQAPPPDLDGGTIMQPGLEPPAVVSPPASAPSVPQATPVQMAGVGQEEAPDIVTKGPRGVPSQEDPRHVVPYIRQAAERYGIDPDVAVNVAKSEGLRTFTSGIPGEKSYSAFQLNTQGGMGNDFMRDTGLDPRDPRNERAAIDYALHRASQEGWGAFHGAKNAYGYGPWEGIGDHPTSAMAFAGQGAQGAGETAGLGADEGGYTPPPPRGRTGGLATGDTPPSRGGFGFGFNPDLGQALMAAGFGMAAAGARPGATFAGSVGQGGLTGLGAYGSLQRQHLAEQQLERQNAREAELERHGRATETETATYHRAAQAHQERMDERLLNQPKALTPGQQLIDPRTGKVIAGNETGSMSDAAVDFAVDRLRAGDKSALQNLGRGAQSGQNLVRIQNRMAERATAEGWTGAQMAAAQANFTSQAAAAKTAAVRSANVETAIEEANQTFPLAIEASANLPRTSFVPFNKLEQMVREGTSSPAQIKYNAAIRGAITAYAQAMSRTGTNSVHAQQAAEELINRATGHEGIIAAFEQMGKEMEAAKVAPEIVRKHILERIGGGKGPPGTEAAAPAATATATAKPKPTDADISYAKAHPEVREKFIERFGVNP